MSAYRPKPSHFCTTTDGTKINSTAEAKTYENMFLLNTHTKFRMTSKGKWYIGLKPKKLWECWYCKNKSKIELIYIINLKSSDKNPYRLCSGCTRHLGFLTI